MNALSGFVGARLSRSMITALVLSLIAFLLVYATPLDLWFNGHQLKVCLLILITLICFVTGILPEFITALLFMLMAVLFSLAPPDVVFSGFSSTAVWLIFSGLVLGIAINETGLASKMAAGVSGYLSGGYLQLIAGLVILATLLGFLMPSSMGRVLLFVPLAMAIAERCAFQPGSNGHTGIALAAAFGCHVPTFAVMPANVPNMVFLGAAETLYQWVPGYGEYLLLHFPVLGLLKGICIVVLIVWLFPDTPRISAPDSVRISADSAENREVMSKNQKKLVVIMLTTLAFWVTDAWHHIPAAWIGLSAAILLLSPGIGLVSQKSFNSKMNLGSILFVVGIMALGAVINSSGIGQILGEQLNRGLPLQPGADAMNFAWLSVTSFIMGVLTTLPGAPAVMTPFAEQMSQSSGLPLSSVLMTQVLGFSTILFPYQSAPMILAMQLAGVPVRQAGRLCLYLLPLTLLVLFPLDYLWWVLSGWL